MTRHPPSTFLQLLHKHVSGGSFKHAPVMSDTCAQGVGAMAGCEARARGVLGICLISVWLLVDMTTVDV